MMDTDRGDNDLSQSLTLVSSDCLQHAIDALNIFILHR